MIRYLQRLKAKKGFTIIELIVVIAIMGILMAVILPSFMGDRERVNAARSAANDFYSAIQATMTKFSTYDGPLSPAFSENSNLGVIRYYPLMGGNYPYDASYSAGGTDAEFPARTNMYIMVHATSDIISDIAVVTRATNNSTGDPGMYELLKRNEADRNTEFGKKLAGEISDRILFKDGYYYAKVEFNPPTGTDATDMRRYTVKVDYAAYCDRELPAASGDYTGFVTSTISFGSDYKLNWNGQICGTCAHRDETGRCVGMAGTSLV